MLNNEYALITGATSGLGNDFSRLLAFMGYTSHLYGVELLRDRAIFSTWNDCGACEYMQVEGERSYTVKNDGKKAAIFVDNKELITVDCKTRVVTDLDGKIISTYSMS